MENLESLIEEGNDIINQRSSKERLNLSEKIWLAKVGKELMNTENIFSEKILEKINVRFSQNMEFPKYEIENIVALLVAEKDNQANTTQKPIEFKGYGI